MFGSMNLTDYEGLASDGGLIGGGGEEIYGISSAAEVDALNKALTAGSDVNNPGSAPGEGFPLRVEDLDNTLFTTTYQVKDAKFWRSLYKDEAYNTVVEYNRLDEYGAGDSYFIGEGELPEEDDSTYSRQFTKIKFMGTTRRVTHVMQRVQAAHGPAVARETINGAKAIIRQIERSCFRGNEDYIPVQFDGLEALMVKAYNSTLSDDGQYLGYEDADNVIDLRGEPLTEDHVTDLATLLVKEPNYGAPSGLWGPLGPLADLSKALYPRQRVQVPLPNSAGIAGIKVSGVATPYGDIMFNPDIFIPESSAPGAAAGNASKRPGSPSVGTVTSPAYTGSNKTFFGASDAGAYWYKVVAGSRFGRSAAVTTASAHTVAAGDQVQFDVTDAGPNTTYYEVYRSAKGGAADTAKSIFRVKRTGASQTIVDLNRFLPGCERTYMLSEHNEVYKWKQLAPFSKIDLATIDTSVRWMQVLYGALQLMKPKQVGMFINIGRLPTGAYAA